MDQAPKDDALGPQASFDSLNGSSDDDAFSEVTGISKRSAGWGSLAGFHGAERHVSRFFRRFIPSHTTAQTGQPACACEALLTQAELADKQETATRSRGSETLFGNNYSLCLSKCEDLQCWP